MEQATNRPSAAAVVIHLVLTYHWFDEMVAGRKDTEYRAMTPHWMRLIWFRRHRITHARFSRAYTSRTMTRRVLSVSIGDCPYEGWDGEYYRIHLDSVANADLEPARKGV
jgi:hypothetical protein